MAQTRRLAAAAAAAAIVLVLAIALIDAAPWDRSARDVLDQEFTSSQGLTSRYHLFRQGVPTDRPVGLVVHFHGDGAYEFEHPESDYALGGPDGIVAAARDRDLLVLSALSPDRRGTVTWWERGERKAEYASELLRDVALARYDIDPGNIWLVGYSGGAQFITQYFVPRYWSMIEGGGSIVFGGGGPPEVDPEPFSDAFRARFAMHWYTGADDTGTPPEWYDARADAEDGHAWYRAQGFDATLEVPPGVDHDDLPFGRILAQRLARPAIR